MAWTYSPKTFAPDHVQEIFSEVLFGARAISRGLVRGITNIKHSQAITSQSGDIEFGARVSQVTEAVIAAASGNIAFSDGTLTPIQLMAFETFDENDLRNSRFGKTMAPGARNIESSEFITAVLDYCLPRMAESYERRMFVGITAATKTAVAASSLSVTQKAWAAAQTAGLVDGLVAKTLTKIIAGAAVNQVVSAVMDSSNVAAQYAAIYAACPGEVASRTDCVIFAPLSDRALILQYNVAATYRDLFTVSGVGTEAERFAYLGVPIEFVQCQGKNAGSATGRPVRQMGRAGTSGDYAFGTDLLSDLNTAQIDKTGPFDTLIGMRMDVTLDTEVLVPQQKVLYL